MTLNSPIGSSAYFILLFIDLPSFSPIARTINADDIPSICEPYRDDALSNAANTIESLFLPTMGRVFCNDTVRIKKSTLGQRKRNAMLRLVFFILILIPFEARLFHVRIIGFCGLNCNIKVFINIWIRKFFNHSQKDVPPAADGLHRDRLR
jgi:hypothetical protein